MLVAVHVAEAGLHAPDRDQRSRRNAIALLDLREHGGLRDLEFASARYDGRSAALGEKLLEGQTEAMLPAIGADRGGGIVGAHQSVDAVGGDAPGARFIGKLALPGVKARCRIAALCRLGFAAGSGHSQERRERDCLQTPVFGHSIHPMRAPPPLRALVASITIPVAAIVEAGSLSGSAESNGGGRKSNCPRGRRPFRRRIRA